MVRKLGTKGTISPTESRKRATKLKQRKIDLGIECFWTSTDSSDYIDDDVLADL